MTSVGGQREEEQLDDLRFISTSSTFKTVLILGKCFLHGECNLIELAQDANELIM